ncbi:polymorphic toxin-type HINT domain-containing protein [Streptomyces sp. YS-B37]|uniref:polymorphic toxin-type HINT domain-containing protein n=1 Tax=Streptomyces sp. YS-B37 TaxID=3407669 RepID=UPI003B5083E1
MGNEGECNVYGYAASSIDVAGVEIGSARFLRALTKAARAVCSFTPSTEVLMKGGKKKPIGKIKPGDKVEAADPETGKHIGARTVSARLVHLDNDLLDVQIRTGKGSGSVIHTTYRHPFWDDTAKAWVQAGELHNGHALAVVAGAYAVAVGVRGRSGNAEMYNLTFEQLHTYYVLAGNTPVLVHNIGNCPIDGLEHGVIGEAASLDRLQNSGYTDVTPQVRFINSNGDVFIGDWVAVESKMRMRWSGPIPSTHR